MAVNIPVMPPVWKPVERQYPITQRENVMRALNHEKPVWMPNLYGDSQMVNSALNKDVGARTTDGVDWFGTFYKYEESQKGTTPMPGLLNDITEWREKFKAPDLSQFDWKGEAAEFKRDPNKALYMRMSNGTFERLHICMGFEQALVDLISEPEECAAFFEYYTDYKIDLFTRMNDVYHFDYVVCADDYGTKRAPFFSTELFEATLLKPQRRFVEAVHKAGVKFIHHCCGKIDSFIPYFVEEIGYDGLEIQDLNDLKSILKTYGDKICFNVKPDPQLVFNDEATEEQVIENVRELVDTYGAHVSQGSGALGNVSSSFENLYYAAEKELYEYSLEKYRGL